MGFGPSQERTLDTNPKTGGERPGAGLWPRLFGQGRGGPRAVVYDPAPDLTAVPSDPAGLARALGDLPALKRRFDPFTGCFVSRIPRVVALETAAEFREGWPEAGVEFVRSGASRLSDELAFTNASTGELERRLPHPRLGPFAPASRP
jgi:hypothetical protein